MLAGTESYSSFVEHQLSNLQKERTVYVMRLSELLGSPNRAVEVKGYLRIIENINEAAIRLARTTPPVHYAD